MAGYVVDLQLRDRELGQLLDRIATAQAEAAYADGRIAATIQYASPQVWSPEVPSGVRRGLERLVEETAAGQVAAVQRAGAAADIAVLPWHDDVRAARDAYLRYARARVALLRAGAREVAVLRTPHPELAEQLDQVREELAAAGASADEVRAALTPP